MEYYNTKTKDVIWNKALPVINGAFSPDGGPKANYTTNLNMCETSNKGFELALIHVILIFKSPGAAPNTAASVSSPFCHTPSNL